MWRTLNNISRAFRNHLLNPRPSVGVLSEDDTETEERCERSVHNHDCRDKEIHHWSDDVDREYIYKGNGNFSRCQAVDEHEPNCGRYKEGNNDNDNRNDWERQKTFHDRFWRLLNDSRSIFGACPWGSAVVLGTETDSYKRRTRLLYRVLFALSNHDTLALTSVGKSVLPSSQPQKEENCFEPLQPSKKPLAIKDAAGSAVDNEINISKSETFESAVNEFQLACQAYTAGSESVLGLTAIEKGDMTNALKHLKHSCRLGNSSACFNLALCYETGNGVPQNMNTAIRYYQKAGEMGHSKALYNLGLLCLQVDDGAGQESDSDIINKKNGLEFLKQAAQLGLPEAQTYLGLYHVQELHEPSKAVSYFKAAADQNDHEAQYLLGVCYETGLGVQTNECIAANLYYRAAHGGHDLALFNLAAFNEHGLGGLPKNTETALEMYQQAAKLGNSQAQERLSQLQTMQANNDEASFGEVAEELLTSSSLEASTSKQENSEREEERKQENKVLRNDNDSQHTNDMPPFFHVSTPNLVHMNVDDACISNLQRKLSAPNQAVLLERRTSVSLYTLGDVHVDYLYGNSNFSNVKPHTMKAIHGKSQLYDCRNPQLFSNCSTKYSCDDIPATTTVMVKSKTFSDFSMMAN